MKKEIATHYLAHTRNPGLRAEDVVAYMKMRYLWDRIAVCVYVVVPLVAITESVLFAIYKTTGFGSQSNDYIVTQISTSTAFFVFTVSVLLLVVRMLLFHRNWLSIDGSFERELIRSCAEFRRFFGSSPEGSFWFVQERVQQCLIKKAREILFFVGKKMKGRENHSRAQMNRMFDCAKKFVTTPGYETLYSYAERQHQLYGGKLTRH